MPADVHKAVSKECAEPAGWHLKPLTGRAAERLPTCPGGVLCRVRGAAGAPRAGWVEVREQDRCRRGPKSLQGVWSGWSSPEEAREGWRVVGRGAGGGVPGSVTRHTRPDGAGEMGCTAGHRIHLDKGNGSCTGGVG